jgi:hypothetical protein
MLNKKNIENEVLGVNNTKPLWLFNSKTVIRIATQKNKRQCRFFNKAFPSFILCNSFFFNYITCNLILILKGSFNYTLPKVHIFDLWSSSLTLLYFYSHPPWNNFTLISFSLGIKKHLKLFNYCHLLKK